MNIFDYLAFAHTKRDDRIGNSKNENVVKDWSIIF